MSFVRKPRPYSSGLPNLPVSPAAPSPKPVREKRRSDGRRSDGPRSSWASAVTALAVLGLVALLLVGGTGLANLLWRDAQFRSAAAGVADVMR